MINATLPLQMKVLEKSSLWHYTLQLNHKKVRTKSMVELEVGAQYLAELYTYKGGVVHFKHLVKCPKLHFFEEGLALIVGILEENLDFKNTIISELIKCTNQEKYQIFKEMLFASFENIYHIPFVFENKACVFQMKKNEQVLELYLYFSVFGALKILYETNSVSVFSPFPKVCHFLSKHLQYKVLQQDNIKPLFEFGALFDFKG
ncbi:hypothetical protein OQH60_02685 [Campylobacter sp. MIT 21-1685]|uniref:hypothetical protein n=1 Tax=unclassified Campylobacter TaxID=2593542 RepID=UPI00224ABBCE|nr:MULTISPECIES: hypothetical protein [unclassified Campylobacter]MCX2682776.1 hypothetical protein [Campylobacter sp. MIT 21-1684]MCX2751078.1 hypothetical protein [Campylobacter sp. MIT 21-1682]MCX2807257.1 hypothetical protein [Campylobacter sp. MIT 21-1685]